jgi:hypothetical protein
MNLTHGDVFMTLENLVCVELDELDRLFKVNVEINLLAINKLILTTQNTSLPNIKSKFFLAN